MHGTMFSSILGLYPPEGTHLLMPYSVVTTKNVSRHCPVPPEGGKAAPLWPYGIPPKPAAPRTVKAPLMSQLHWDEVTAIPKSHSHLWVSLLIGPLPALGAPLVPSSSCLFAFLVLSRNIDLKRSCSSWPNSRVPVTWK